MNSSEQKNNIIIQTNRFFLDLIEYVFFSFSIDIEKNTENKLLYKRRTRNKAHL